ncbi:MAG: YicC family protein [Muribaculaceae bacterium]|nr:YicC family protein [Muribaculaceae bacterium]
MLYSMTGFGKAVVQEGTKKFTVEIKSLNSKQLDLASRVPPSYREQELEIRSLVAKRLERGKVDMNIYIESSTPDNTMVINAERVKDYKLQLSQLASMMGVAEPSDWISVLMRLPDTVKSETPAVASENETAALIEAVKRALDQLVEYRRTEGKRLEEFFATRIERIAALLAEVPRYETQRVTRIRTRIEESLSRIPQVEYDKGRLEQEMIFYIEKLDINEEKQRLAQHLSYFLETMNADGGQGKKLGFIAQEMGREINTLGSKSNQADMQILVVKMKDELEQIKEQVLNVM